MVALRSMSKKAIKSQSESSKVASEAVANPRTVTAFSSQDRILHLFGSTQKRPAILGSQHRPRRLPGSHEVHLVSGLLVRRPAHVSWPHHLRGWLAQAVSSGRPAA
ncbi:hypothetical protein B296_00053513 [Ensete ventricosum]|uniref:Uncharacterized protein n=1 Tax=Ensete ventricosum TaxID=4639 RepID=A0A426XRS3_ENSVE|nr:hypothetical protein B296_00053513 [Ensete ventricosum]